MDSISASIAARCRRRYFVRITSVAFVFLIAIGSSTNGADPPGLKVEKARRLIEFGWDEPDTNFLRQQLLLRGGHVATNAVLPAIRGTWTYQPTDYGGCQIFLRDHDLDEVDRLFLAAFGEPQKKRDAQPGLKSLRIYNRSRVGVTLLIVRKDNGVWIGCPGSQLQ